MFISNHFNDLSGNPAGGSTYDRGFAIAWQNGPLGRGPDRQPANGAFVEDIIKAAYDRLEYYQRNLRFKSSYNEAAMNHLQEAFNKLHDRTVDREQRQVEGTHGV